jgi:hypothetical protein
MAETHLSARTSIRGESLRANWDENATTLEVVENVVARDGIEPPPPAFQGYALTL